MTGAYPRLRSRTRRRKSGRVVVYYFYDATTLGEGEIPLGKNFDSALAQWHEINEHGTKAGRIIGTLEEAFARWESEILPSYESVETRRGYAKNLRTIRPVFGQATWELVDMPTIKKYLQKRSAKTQGNREMALLSVIWNWARGEGLTSMPWPAAGMERSRWKNKEKPRRIRVSDEIYDAIYAHASPSIRDCMTLGAATGLRLTDCISVEMPCNGMLSITASKTGKQAEWDISQSAVLPDIVRRREQILATHNLLLSTPDGHPITSHHLRYGWDKARKLAAAVARQNGNTALAIAIEGLYLRDMRKRAAQKAGSLEEASALLQHSSPRITERHYGGIRKLKPTA